ncbi:hypothetical protein [Actinokineospora sp.]|uniref:hypothetical protein n=1 Tax=Actinokineospora sp. TaxID=1872133 RepID=UPI004037A878
MTGRDLYRTEVPAGPAAAERAEEVRGKFLRLVAEDRQPKTNATVMVLIGEHLKVAEMGLRNKATLEG